ncbi:MAG: hypothetical protein R2809_10150 [Flavobacteriales bacterium]
MTAPDKTDCEMISTITYLKSVMFGTKDGMLKVLDISLLGMNWMNNILQWELELTWWILLDLDNPVYGL